ncbi:hypothetical protein K0M31_011931 [Melipona bicolor]|uniref:Uncharacterized protein n=1 Tax=Melipona bicolor TaxID=60889 RepID=A0AA40KVH2_9HYME|nr:hypothetical protein K0M31_011931 [Melipona bicolor]
MHVVHNGDVFLRGNVIEEGVARLTRLQFSDLRSRLVDVGQRKSDVQQATCRSAVYDVKNYVSLI